MYGHEYGVLFGHTKQTGSGYYIGMPQGAEGNIAIVGGNGSGKSSGIAKPTLLTFNGGICATDIKGELSDCYAEIAEELLRHFKPVRPYIIFNPMDVDSPSYDPFWLFSKDEEANLVSNAWDMARAIIQTTPDDKEPFWKESERSILVAALMYYYKLGLSFSETICMILESDIKLLCQKIFDSCDIRAKMTLGTAAEMKSETLACIERGLRNALVLYATDPYISHAFRGKREDAVCFTWEDLNTHHIFLRVPANKIEHWSGAINLMYTQLIRYLEHRPEKFSAEGEKNAQILLLMDEFARFGKLEMISDAMSTLRSKKVNICLILQSIAQLDKIYGEYERRIILDNCQYKAILQANDAETQKYISDLIGTCTRRQNGINEMQDESQEISGYSLQMSETREPIVFPHELSTLKDILLLTPYGFCRIGKCQFIREPWKQMLSSLCRMHYAESQEILHASLDDPIDWDADVFCLSKKLNKNATLLTIEERLANAKRRINVTWNQKESDENEKTVQEEDDSYFRSAISGLVLQYFPEIHTDLLYETSEGPKVNITPPENLFSILTNDQVSMERLKRMADWPGSDGKNV